MRFLKVLALAGICVLCLSLVASAGQNKFGVADNRNLTFTTATRVGNSLLPEGDYRISHVMEGENHIMVFKQINTGNPVEVRVKCQLVPLEKRAEQTQTQYVLNSDNERVLRSVIFRGDSAEHTF